MYYVNKIVGWILSPMGIVVLGAAACAVSAFFGRRKLAWVCGIGAFASNDIAIFEKVLNDAIFNRSEDYAVKPSLWESLSEEERMKFEIAIIPEHLREDMPDKPSLIKLNDCSIV